MEFFSGHIQLFMHEHSLGKQLDLNTVVILPDNIKK